MTQSTKRNYLPDVLGAMAGIALAVFGGPPAITNILEFRTEFIKRAGHTIITIVEDLSYDEQQ